MPFPWIGGFLSSWSLACTQAVCGRISTTFAICRQKSGRCFLRFSLSLALFPPFPFFRLSLFYAFPSFPRFFKKQKPLRRRETWHPMLQSWYCCPNAYHCNYLKNSLRIFFRSPILVSRCFWCFSNTNMVKTCANHIIIMNLKRHQECN